LTWNFLSFYCDTAYNGEVGSKKNYVSAKLDGKCVFLVELYTCQKNVHHLSWKS